uniref:Malate dehydrogenase, mitochondrial n=1 Tax=Timema shepardi TaxID=629360 RepID=A0A7R9AMZ1_TIMSH|nr:unnamed protein product [Timema shepardi]
MLCLNRNLLNTLCIRAGKPLLRALFSEEHYLPESIHDVRVTVLGAAGKVGHLASLLLKQSPLLAELRLYDVSGVEELGADVSLINTNCAVRVFSGVEELPDALEGTDIVLFMVGSPGKPPMTSKDLFTLNAELTAALAHQCAALCPEAILGVCTKPVNGMVPLVSEVMKLYGVYNPDKIVGMTTLNTIRANSTVAEEYLTNAAYVHVPVIGGASTETAVPLLSRALPFSAFSQEMTEMLVTKIMDREAGYGICSAAHAVSRFIQTLARGLHNKKSVMSAFVRSDTCPGLRYFCNQIRFGPHGVMRNYGIPPLTPFEIQLLYSVRHKVKHEIVAGEKFAREN